MATLYVIGTPIGNLEDMTFRAIRIMREVDVLACEDTRQTRKLLTHFEIPKPQQMFSCNQINEHNSRQGIVKLLDAGRTVGLVSDAGMPGISDPGYQVVTAAIEGGHRVEVIPGPSAGITALISSGLPASSFYFAGFPPRKPGRRKKLLTALKDMEATLLFFESPHRLGAFLADAKEVLGDRKAAVSIELTKKFEETDRDQLSALTERYADETVRGEVTVTIAGFSKAAAPSDPIYGP
ncbi:MAG: 16S rRNA (cytidine(1402)-2'-O)-methyltransferase [Myxococcota bacterium]